MDNQEYRIDDEPLYFVHEEVTLTTFPTQHNLCGEIGYDALFMDAYIGISDVPMSYDVAFLEFAFESSDASLVGTHDFIIEAYFVNYPFDLFTDAIG